MLKYHADSLYSNFEIVKVFTILENFPKISFWINILCFIHKNHFQIEVIFEWTFGKISNYYLLYHNRWKHENWTFGCIYAIYRFLSIIQSISLKVRWLICKSFVGQPLTSPMFSNCWYLSIDMVVNDINFIILEVVVSVFN